MKKIIHFPYGYEDPYVVKYATERIPHEPLENEKVFIEFGNTEPELGQRAWVEYRYNVIQKKSRAQNQFSESNISYWKAEIEGINAGETIEYRIASGRGPKSAVYSEWFSYTVKKWVDADNFINVDSEYISFENNLMQVKKENIPGKIFKTEYLTDKNSSYDFRIYVKRDKDEFYYGLGEHYEKIEIKPGDKYYVNVYDQCKVQKNRGYAPVPFIMSNKGFALLAEMGLLTEYEIKEEHLLITVRTRELKNKKIRFRYWDEEKPISIVSQLYEIIRPVTPPLWAFGPWLSANQWNSQKKMEKVLQKSLQQDLPATVAVIEAWSDEECFYIFNGAEYTVVDGKDPLHMSDFKFKDPWPDPKGMVDEFHKNSMKVLLWQIPLLKPINNKNCQHIKDIDYALKNNFAVKKTDGSYYKVPEDRWFGGSYVVDFFNEKVAEWWQLKRKYLIDEIGIDGFKTDGGEHLWGYSSITYDGLSGVEARNLFPEKYLAAAKGVLKQDGALFSRSGYTHSPHYSLFWVGDEDSDIEAMKDNFTAGLNVSISGNPFWGWDIAGFSGEMPSKEFYITAVKNSVFIPIFQLHSEDPGDPVPSAERTPWNMAEIYNDDEIINIYRKYASLRMSISPYIYQEALNSTKNFTPLTSPLFLHQTGNNPESLAYMFGRDMVVKPSLMDNSEEFTITLPEGEWIDFFNGKSYEGEKQETFKNSFDSPFVFLKKGAIIPLSVPESGILTDANWSQKTNAVLFTDYSIDQDMLKKIKTDWKEIKKIGILSSDVSEDIMKISWL